MIEEGHHSGGRTSPGHKYRDSLSQMLHSAFGALSNANNVVVVAAIGIDRLSQINDTWGFHTGDLVLLDVEARLKNEFGTEQSVLHVGADHFVVVRVVGQSDDVEAETARSVVELVSGRYVAGDHHVYVTASVGVAASDDGDDDPFQLLSAAETARVEARRSGGRRWKRANQSLRVRVREQVRTEQALYGAIESNELSVRYQPIIDLASQATIGYEALARWQSAELGNVPPSHFIPRAEETGLIVPLGHWILDEVTTECSPRSDAMKKSVLSPTSLVAVNVSAVQIRLDLDTLVTHLIETSESIRGHLWVEITESALLEIPKAVQEMFTKLRESGIHLVVDDFGTGYSSFAQLRNLPVDAVKIDRQFIWRIHESPRDRAIVRAMIELAHALGILAVAEGVETRQQLDALREMSCDQVQGFLYSPAVPFSQLENLDREQKAQMREAQ